MKASEIASTTSSQVVTCEIGEVDVAPTALFGWSVAETAGGAAKIRVRDGSDVSGAILSGLISLSANESTRDLLMLPIDVVSGGLFLEIVSGQVETVIYWG